MVIKNFEFLFIGISEYKFAKLKGPEPKYSSVELGLYFATKIPHNSDLFI